MILHIHTNFPVRCSVFVFEIHAESDSLEEGVREDGMQYSTAHAGIAQPPGTHWTSAEQPVTLDLAHVWRRQREV